MGVATAHTVSLQGAEGHVVDVQVDVTSGQVSTAMVGHPDQSVSESRERSRSALHNCGYEWPATKRMTILLSPADLPKRGSHYDLAVAIGVLAATEAVPTDALAGVVLIGELTLDGLIRAVPGVLPMTMAACRQGIGRVIVPEPQAHEAAMVPGMEVVGVRSLTQAVAVLREEEIPVAPEVAPLSGGPLLSWRGENRLVDADLADIRGMADPRYALEVAAAGGHHLMLSGPKGAGKTTLAERLATVLPDLDVDEALELTAIHSLADALAPGAPMMVRPPFRAPHHSASAASILGGGSGRVRPGEVSKALHGVLFLDEFALFRRDIVEALREPLESGEVTLARREETATFPARSLVVLAANPCPCGNYSPTQRDHECHCSAPQRRAYDLKLGGPVVDRIDIVRHVTPLTEHDANDPLAVTESSAEVRDRVLVARRRQLARYGETPWRLNGDVPGPVLRREWPMAADATRLLDTEVYKGRLTQRGAVRVHRLAWTVADLRAAERPDHDDLDVAMRLRTGRPLLLGALRRAPAELPHVAAVGE